MTALRLSPPLCEFLGSFALILSVLLSNGNPLVVGGTLAAALFAVGGHFNPAISISMLAKGSIPAPVAALFIALQVLGGLAALLVVTAGRKLMSR